MKARNKKGFTLVELSLAITFITVLLITIGYLTVQITSIYEKGLAMKSVNATGKELIDDFSRAITSSPARSITSLCSSAYSREKYEAAYQACVQDKARLLMYHQRYDTIIVSGENKNVPANGVFCTGRYSYIWNTAYMLNDEYTKEDNMPKKKGVLLVGDNAISENYRLLKVVDYDRLLCTQHLKVNEYKMDDNQTEYKLDSEPYLKEELLEKTNDSTFGASDLALYDLTVFAPSIHKLTSSGFYSASFILATLRGGININSSGEFCSEPPDNLNTDFAYCAINKFNFAVKAAGEKLNTERW